MSKLQAPTLYLSPQASPTLVERSQDERKPIIRWLPDLESFLPNNLQPVVVKFYFFSWKPKFLKFVIEPHFPLFMFAPGVCVF